MSDSLPSDDLAEDFKSSLEDLAMNSRIEISNLTIIARENLSHASTLSRVLVNHIKRTHPDKKLPALYVLDSIVKNVGSPYTIFLGHDLYRTFMDAYTAVNEPVRRKLDEMLKTWKEPVPGSIETRSVFPIENIRPIENALIKARTAAVQQQQEQMRRQHELLTRGRPTATPPTGWRSTATPPTAINRYPPPHGYVPSVPLNGAQPTPRSAFVPSPIQSSPSALSLQQISNHSQPYIPPVVELQPTQQDLTSLHRDLQNLIEAAKAEWANNLSDTSIQNRLQNLLNLQQILQTQQLPLDQLIMVRNQVSQLSASSQPSLPVRQVVSSLENAKTLPQGTTAQFTTFLQAQAPQTPLPPTPIPNSVVVPQATMPRIPSPAAQPNLDLSSLLASNNLASILASASKPQHQPEYSKVSSNAENGSALGPVYSTSAAAPPSAAVSGDSLMASLRAAGILPNAPRTPVSGHVPNASTSSSQTANSGAPTAPPNNITLTSASLKISRPNLIESLFAKFPNQCSTCGKRFSFTEDDRAKKARHLDWHFRTKMRRDDSVRRGQSRSWYVSELEWIHWKDTIDDDPATGFVRMDPLAAKKAAAVLEATKNDPKNKYVPVPDDPALKNAPCPICQEKFQVAYREDTGDWVWEDAIRVGNRIYHASCHAEVKVDDGGKSPLSRTATPDSVLGKRKAQGADMNSLRAKASKETP